LHYRPEPIDTDGVALDKDLLALVETLARHAHDVWARQRLADGWHLGPARDDDRKEHPCLVPYEELPDSERTYDRNAVLETIKALLALGYRLDRPAATGRPPTSAAGVIDFLRQLDSLDLTSLVALWSARRPGDQERPEVYAKLGARLLQLGEPMLASDVLGEGLMRAAGDVRLRQLQALALARVGATDRANGMLTSLVREGSADEETLGLLARTYKDLGMGAAEGPSRVKHLRRAFETYERAYKEHGGHWSGINAATLAVLLGQRDAAAALALEVHDRCRSRVEAGNVPEGDRYWTLATLGEASLILGNWSEAEDWYGRAVAEAAGRYGDVSSTRRNARLLAGCTATDPSRIERWFPVPRVIAFGGHMVDHADGGRTRFPGRLEAAVRDAVRDRVVALDGKLGFSSAACGSDILFLETILSLGGEANVVLPYSVEEFATDCVTYPGESDWLPRYRTILSRAAQVVTASLGRPASPMASYEYANHMLTGLALLRAQQLDTELRTLAVWDGEAGERPGGTASLVELWRRRGLQLDIVNLKEVGRKAGADIVSSTAVVELQGEPTAEGLTSRIMAVMFADAVNFSRLGEAELALFVEHFLGAIAKLIARSRDLPVVSNTWGDGIYLVFTDVAAAGRFALDLADLVNTTDWAAHGLPAELNLRIGLHAGPVYECVDPITTRANYIGTHVSRGARIEPITPPGHVYASQAFAALVASEGAQDVVCEYVGRTAWAKGYGTFPTFHVRRSSAGRDT